jgi:disulfide bond formation protein DsbB
MMIDHRRAPWLALAIPLALYGGALVSQFVFHLAPCEMCYWQRWPHQAAILIALAALMLRPRPYAQVLTALAALAIITSGLIGAFHAGVEYGWWEGLTKCTAPMSGGMTLDDIMAQPVVRCDVPQWTLGPISLAGFNFIFSTLGGLAVLALLRRPPATPNMGA